MRNSLDLICSEVLSCHSCSLRKSCRSPVFQRDAERNVNLDNKRVLIVGEAPGEQEDLEGLPFIGRSGDLLDKLLGTIEGAEDIAITNLVKCRPPNNRKPTAIEIQSCIDYLIAEILVIRPVLIVTMGSVATSALQGRPVKITQVAGRVQSISFPSLTDKAAFVTFTLPVFHPSYVLRNNTKEMRRLWWDQWEPISGFLST